MTKDWVDLSTTIAGIAMKNPLVAASGTFGYGEEYSAVGEITWFGAVTVKGTTLRPRPGNPPPRVTETPCGMLNSIGLENPGARIVAEHKIPYLKQFGVPIIVNISGDTYDEFEEIADIFRGVPGVSALEVNVSCPNVEAGGLAFGMDPSSCFKAVKAVKRSFEGPVVAKLTPLAPDIVETAQAAVEGGADALSLINTLLGMVIDLGTRRPVLGNLTGGLSGPAVKPVAVRCIYQVSSAVDVPIIGMGGVTTHWDVLELMMAGATAVGIGSGLLVDPSSPVHIVDGLRRYCEEQGLSDLEGLIGAAWR